MAFVGAVVVAVVAWRSGYLAGDDERFTVTGSLTLYDDDLQTEDGPNEVYCAGQGGYSDIQGGVTIGDSTIGGSPVTIRDGNGTVLATGILKVGRLSGADTCWFEFEVGDIPDADFYQVEVSHRGGITYSRQQMEGSGWRVNVTLGEPK